MTGVSSNTSITVSDISNTAEVITGNIIRQRAKFQRPDQTVAISGLPNQGIKDISQVETEIIRRQKNITVASDPNVPGRKPILPRENIVTKIELNFLIIIRN